jgi:hypothetical protein
MGRLRNAKHASTFKVALFLLHRTWETKRHAIRLSNTAVPGLARRSKSRALEELEALGLVVVERQIRRSPLITVLLATEGG